MNIEDYFNHERQQRDNNRAFQEALREDNWYRMLRDPSLITRNQAKSFFKESEDKKDIMYLKKEIKRIRNEYPIQKLELIEEW